MHGNELILFEIAETNSEMMANYCYVVTILMLILIVKCTLVPLVHPVMCRLSATE